MAPNKKYHELSTENVQRRLTTRIIGREVIYLKEIDSTNAYGMKLLRGGIVTNGTVIIANHQTGGKGRHGRAWEAPRGKALLLSVVFTEIDHIERPQLITFAGALSVVETILQLFPGLTPTIKWPNDILIDNKKLAGILVETDRKTNEDPLHAAVLGIGININQSRNDFPPELHDNAASLFMFTGRRILRLDTLIVILEQLEKIFLSLEAGKEDSFWTRIKKFSSTLGKPVKISTSHDNTIVGTAVDIDTDGGLWVRLDSGKSLKVYSGEVEEIKWIE